MKGHLKTTSCVIMNYFHIMYTALEQKHTNNDIHILNLKFLTEFCTNDATVDYPIFLVNDVE